MPAEQQRQIASAGGKKAHANGTAHQWTKDEARAAGRKGGLASVQARIARDNERALALMAQEVEA